MQTTLWSFLDLKKAKGPQNRLNKLESFCDYADLDVNLDKTVVTIFNNCGKSLTILFDTGSK